MSILGYAIGIAVCLFLSAFFSSSETALLRLSLHRINDDLSKRMRPSVAAAKELLRSSSRLLVTILLGNNVVNIFATACASALSVYLFGEKVGLIVATVGMTVLVLLFSEIIPKAIAARSPSKVSYMNALPLYLFHKILTPVHLLFDRIIEPLITAIVGSPQEESTRSYESVLMMAREFRRKTSRDDSPLPIIGSAARAAEMTAEEIMVSRMEIVAYAIDISAHELLDKMLEDRYTRVPIFDKDLDNILGVIHLKDLVVLVHQEESSLSTILKPILRVPERKPIFSILAEMQRAFLHMAVVKDEFGGTQGILTQEDILEEIVGEIRDEFDREELMAIRKNSDETFTVLGRILVHDFTRETGIEIIAEKGDTFGGLIFNSLGRTPKLGDHVEVSGVMLTVMDVSGPRVTRVRVEPQEEVSEEEAAEA